MARHLKLESLDWDGEATFWMTRQLGLGRYVVAGGNAYAMPPFEQEGRYGRHLVVVDGIDRRGNFLVKNPWPTGVAVVTAKQMWKFLMTDERPYQYTFWKEK